MTIDAPLIEQLSKATKNYISTYRKSLKQLMDEGIMDTGQLDSANSNAKIFEIQATRSHDPHEALVREYSDGNNHPYGHYEYLKQNHGNAIQDFDGLGLLEDRSIERSIIHIKDRLDPFVGKQKSRHNKLIPIILKTENLFSPNLGVEACLAAKFDSCGFPFSKIFTQRALCKGDFLIFLYDLGKILKCNQNIVIDKIQDLINRYPGNRFIIISDIKIIHAYFERINTVTISKLDKNQFEQLIHNSFLSEQILETQISEHLREQLQRTQNMGAKELSQEILPAHLIYKEYVKSSIVPNFQTTIHNTELHKFSNEQVEEGHIGQYQAYEKLYTNFEKEILAKIAYTGFESHQLFFLKDQLIKIIDNFICALPNSPDKPNESQVLKAIVAQSDILIERETNIYSFSNLAFQKFLTAQYIVKLGSLDELVKHTNNIRWRDIFITVSDLMKDRAIILLEKLEVKAQELSDYPKLNKLLVWLAEKTCLSSSDHSGEIRRIYALKQLTNQLHFCKDALDHARSLALDCACEYDDAIDHVRFLPSEADFAFVRDRSLINASTLANSRNKVSNLSKVLAYSQNLALLMSESEACAEMSLEIPDVDSQSLSLYLENISVQGIIPAEQLQSLLSSYNDLSLELFDLSNNDIEVISNYFSIYQLMIDCKSKAQNVSNHKWDKIKHNIFFQNM